MIDITTDIDGYRECIGFLWNKCCHKKDDRQSDWDRYDSFDDICGLLFSLMILQPYGWPDYRKSSSYEEFPGPVPCIHILPVAEDNIPILINRDVKSGGYWDYSADNICKSDVDLRFIDIFDFDVQGSRDFEYYRVRIVGTKNDMSLIGRDALIRVDAAKVLIDVAKELRSR